MVYLYLNQSLLCLVQAVFHFLASQSLKQVGQKGQVHFQYLNLVYTIPWAMWSNWKTDPVLSTGLGDLQVTSNLSYSMLLSVCELVWTVTTKYCKYINNCAIKQWISAFRGRKRLLPKFRDHWTFKVGHVLCLSAAWQSLRGSGNTFSCTQKKNILYIESSIVKLFLLDLN